jgi:hypothetical protein
MGLDANILVLDGQIARTLRFREAISPTSPSETQILLLPLPPTWFKVWANLLFTHPIPTHTSAHR